MDISEDLKNELNKVECSESLTIDSIKLNSDLGRVIIGKIVAKYIDQFIPMQKCPKCDGQGIVSKPPWIAGDQTTWDSTSTSHQCNVCNGQKVIPMQEIKK